MYISCGREWVCGNFLYSTDQLFCKSKTPLKKLSVLKKFMGENITNQISGKGLISRMYKELLQLNNKQTKTTQFKNG